MKQDKGPLSWLKIQFSKENQSMKNKGKYPYVVLVLLFGIGIMLVSNLFIDKKPPLNEIPVLNNTDSKKNEAVETFGLKKSKDNGVMNDYEQAYETQLKDALDSIVGVSDVSVVVNVDSSEKKVLEKNTKTQTQVTNETDREGGERKVEDQSFDEQPVIIQDGEKEVPIIVETKKPEIRGVLVVAKGADNIQVKKWIIEAVTRSLDVPSHRVSVLPKKTRGDS